MDVLKVGGIEGCMSFALDWRKRQWQGKEIKNQDEIYRVIVSERGMVIN